MTLRELRAEVPSWEWVAVRTGGFGWEYRGIKGHRAVTVRAHAVLNGSMAGDDFETEWRVLEGDKSDSYVSFWLNENTPKRDAATKGGGIAASPAPGKEP